MADQSNPVYFWRETDTELGWLSQWYYCPFSDDQDPRKKYKTAEHYMMHHKALLFNDIKTATAILAVTHPRQARALGRKVTPFSNATWEANRRAIVRKGNLLKFTRAVTEEGFRKGDPAAGVEPPLLDGTLRATLLATGERELVEASPFDRIWGIGFVARDAEAARESWGLNLLGEELMEVRRVLREE